MSRDTSQTPFDLRRVSNCETLTVYRIPRSRFWQYRFRILAEKRYKRGSTQCTEIREATTRAKQAWLEHYAVREVNIPRNRQIAYHVERLQAEQEKKVQRGLRNQRFASVDRHRLAAVTQYFSRDAIDAIDGQRIRDFQDHIYEQNPKISKGTVRHYLVALRKVLKQAALTGEIKTLPQFPDAGGASGINPRTGFSVKEYQTVRKHLKMLSMSDPRYAEVYDVVLFLTNSLLRPSEIKLLTGAHVRIGRDQAGQTLFVRPPNPKVKAYDYETFTMPGALEAFKRMQARAAKRDSYIFFAEMTNREQALRLLGELFSNALIELGLKQTRDGRRTLYSLRHSGISWRLERGEGQIFDVAKWSRTSVAMIEKFYASAYNLSSAATRLRANARPGAKA